VLLREGDRQPVSVSQAITSNTTLADIDQVVDVNASGGEVTIILPAVDNNQRKISIIKVDASAFQVIIDGNGSETINGDTTLILEFQYDAATLVSSSTGWRII